MTWSSAFNYAYLATLAFAIFFAWSLVESLCTLIESKAHELGTRGNLNIDLMRDEE